MSKCLIITSIASNSKRKMLPKFIRYISFLVKGPMNELIRSTVDRIFPQLSLMVIVYRLYQIRIENVLHYFAEVRFSLSHVGRNTGKLTNLEYHHGNFRVPLRIFPLKSKFRSSKILFLKYLTDRIPGVFFHKATI